MREETRASSKFVAVVFSLVAGVGYGALGFIAASMSIGVLALVGSEVLPDELMFGVTMGMAGLAGVTVAIWQGRKIYGYESLGGRLFWGGIGWAAIVALVTVFWLANFVFTPPTDHPTSGLGAFFRVLFSLGGGLAAGVPVFAAFWFAAVKSSGESELDEESAETG